MMEGLAWRSRQTVVRPKGFVLVMIKHDISLFATRRYGIALCRFYFVLGWESMQYVYTQTHLSQSL
uniref:Uncharacterized protein n=1 Tax=Rhizophora mucronata TaxID=61149 RepID=A0A2P2NM31_RHIMU